MLSSITQLQRMHLVTAIGPAWNCSLRMVLKGSEAMFADLCYFSIKSVQLTFVFLVLPCLLLGYLGQAAFLMENLDKSQQIFFLSIPSEAFWPMVFIATLAALIASRAMTTAIFSTIKQATALGCFPRLKIIHTSVTPGFKDKT
ncbi:probable potassium transporter 14 isoform X2 [Miscanthus floridulus]